MIQGILHKVLMNSSLHCHIVIFPTARFFSLSYKQRLHSSIHSFTPFFVFANAGLLDAWFSDQTFVESDRVLCY